MSANVSRRRFLKLAAAGTAGMAVAACAAPTPQVVEKIVTQVVEKQVEKKVVETQVVNKEITKVVEKQVTVAAPTAAPAAPSAKTVRILLDSWAMDEMPFDTFARSFNEANPGVNVVLQSTFEGYDTKVLAQIAAGKVEWSASGINNSGSSGLPRRILSGMFDPMDDFLASSKQKGANLIIKDMVPTLVKASTYQGKFWAIPYSFENISFNWRTDHFAAVGATAAPATWDEWLTIARALKKWGAKDKIVPTSFIPDLDASTGALIYSALENPFREDMLLKWDSPEGLEALKFYRTMVQEELTPPHGFDGWYDMYMAGKLSSVQAQSSRGVWGQLAFGTDKVVTSQIPTYKKGSGAGTAFWGNTISMIKKAPFPQEVVDYLVYTMGPQNEVWQKTCMKTGKTPSFMSAYNFIDTDPQLRTFAWMKDMRAQVERSMMRPFNNYFSIQDSFYAKYVVQFVEPGSKMTPEELAANVIKDSLAEIAKQKK